MQSDLVVVVPRTTHLDWIEDKSLGVFTKTDQHYYTYYFVFLLGSFWGSSEVDDAAGP